MTNNHPYWSPLWRAQALASLANIDTDSTDSQWDLVIVGGGITGAGIYREASRLGLKVLLVEQRDFAWGTSSRSSKMVHGGLRYLGSGQFGLANDSVKERQNLMKELSGLVNPLPFMMGHYKGQFPGPWIFDKLLTIYDWMAGHRYRHYFQKGIRDFLVPGMNSHQLMGATKFADAVTDDARLVMRVLHAGNEDGGIALNYVKAIDTLKLDTLKSGSKVSGLMLEDQQTGDNFEVSANVVINATGAWTDELRLTLGKDQVIRPLRGSHLVIPLWRLPCAFSISFFHPQDKRPVFVFPWEGVCVIGTTDLDHQQSPSNESSITEKEIAYLLAGANEQFPEAELTYHDIRATWSGVRPVVSKNESKTVNTDAPNKPSDEKREHAVWDDNGMISVAGGKLTTYRLIALHVLQTAESYLSGKLVNKDMTSTSHFEAVSIEAPHPGLTAVATKRLTGRYGIHAETIINNALNPKQAFEKIETSDTMWAELIWACQSESILHLDDLLLRRTRIGLLLDDGAESVLSEVKHICQDHLNWNDLRWETERKRYQNIIAQHYSLPETQFSR